MLMKQDNHLLKVNIGLNFLKELVHPQKIELCGASNVGTTAFALFIAKKFHEANLTCLFVDVSRRLTKQYLLQNTYDDFLTVVTATLTSDIYEVFDKFKDSIDLIILDDITGISTSEQYKERHKELLKNLLDYLNREVVNNSIIYINQIRIDPITERVYYPYGYLLDVDSRIVLKRLESRDKYRIIQGKFEHNNFGTEDYFSFKLYQDKLEGLIKE